MLNWTNKQDGVDDVLAEDINNIANNLIEAQKDLGKKITEEGLKEYAVPIKDTGGAPFELIYAQKGDGAEGVVTIETDLSRSNGEVETSPFDNAKSIPIRNLRGNLYTGTPTENMEAVNKKYVDDKLGDIETLLGGI